MADTSGTSVIRDKQGNLLTDPEVIGKAWSDHYEKLAEDEFGRSHDVEYWRNQVEDWDFPHLIELDADFSLDDLFDAAFHLKDHKAPAEDGIVGEWMKALLYV